MLKTPRYFSARKKKTPSEKIIRVTYSVVVLQPATRTPLKHSRTKSPTHNEPRTQQPMW